MSIITLHTIPETSLLKDDETSLCVFDENDNLVADYDLCTGLRLLKTEDGLTIFVSDQDLVPGRWVLLATEMLESTELSTTRVEGFKEGSPASRVVLVDNPWQGCSPGNHVSWTEREERLAICKSCPLFELETMTCGASGRPVLDVTTKQDEYCPQELWGDVERIQQQITEYAFAEGLVEMPQGPHIDPQDQEQFEEELARYLEGL